MNFEEKVPLLWTFKELLTDLFWVPDSNVQENTKLFNKIHRRKKKKALVLCLSIQINCLIF